MEWTWLDLSTYLYNYTAVPFFMTLLMSSFIYIFVVFGLLDMVGDIKKKAIAGPFIVYLTTVLVTIGASLPSHDRILEVKIEKIKNEAVTERNLSKGMEVIERIGCKLEKKYLDGKGECE